MKEEIAFSVPPEIKETHEETLIWWNEVRPDISTLKTHGLLPINNLKNPISIELRDALFAIPIKTSGLMIAVNKAISELEKK